MKLKASLYKLFGCNHGLVDRNDIYVSLEKNMDFEADFAKQFAERENQDEYILFERSKVMRSFIL